MSQEATVQTLFCSQCGRTLSHSDLVQIAGNWVCAECKPAFLSRIMAGGAAASPLGWRFGGFWIRFGARFIDGLVFTIPAAVLFAVLFVPSFMRGQGQAPGNAPNAAFLSAGFITFVLVFFLAGACYEILMLKYRSATLGKMACGLKVIRPDGRSLSWGVCIGRFLMWNVVTSGIPYLNSIFLLATAIIVAVDDEKRALHDRVCDTRVIYKPSVA
jgi:uncharacterized RDD family membrane protein YckC/DNA-directed RNA polymerase subunit RPC12/RpoP